MKFDYHLSKIRLDAKKDLRGDASLPSRYHEEVDLPWPSEVLHMLQGWKPRQLAFLIDKRHLLFHLFQEIFCAKSYYDLLK